MVTQKEMKESKAKLVTRIIADHISWGWGYWGAETNALKAVEKMSHEEIERCLKPGEDA